MRDSRQASQIGKYWAAVQEYLQTGDPYNCYIKIVNISDLKARLSAHRLGDWLPVAFSRDLCIDGSPRLSPGRSLRGMFPMRSWKQVWREERESR